MDSSTSSPPKTAIDPICRHTPATAYGRSLTSTSSIWSKWPKVSGSPRHRESISSLERVCRETRSRVGGGRMEVSPGKAVTDLGERETSRDERLLEASEWSSAGRGHTVNIHQARWTRNLGTNELISDDETLLNWLVNFVGTVISSPGHKTSDQYPD